MFLISHCIFALNQSPRQVHHAIVYLDDNLQLALTSLALLSHPRDMINLIPDFSSERPTVQPGQYALVLSLFTLRIHNGDQILMIAEHMNVGWTALKKPIKPLKRPENRPRFLARKTPSQLAPFERAPLRKKSGKCCCRENGLASSAEEHCVTTEAKCVSEASVNKHNLRSGSYVEVRLLYQWDSTPHVVQMRVPSEVVQLRTNKSLILKTPPSGLYTLKHLAKRRKVLSNAWEWWVQVNC